MCSLEQARIWLQPEVHLHHLFCHSKQEQRGWLCARQRDVPLAAQLTSSEGKPPASENLQPWCPNETGGPCQLYCIVHFPAVNARPVQVRDVSGMAHAFRNALCGLKIDIYFLSSKLQPNNQSSSKRMVLPEQLWSRSDIHCTKSWIMAAMPLCFCMGIILDPRRSLSLGMSSLCLKGYQQNQESWLASACTEVGLSL